jgi:hypothetical protein
MAPEIPQKKLWHQKAIHFRLLAMDSISDYSLSISITAPEWSTEECWPGLETNSEEIAWSKFSCGGSDRCSPIGYVFI